MGRRVSSRLGTRLILTHNNRKPITNTKNLYQHNIPMLTYQTNISKCKSIIPCQYTMPILTYNNHINITYIKHYISTYR